MNDKFLDHVVEKIIIKTPLEAYDERTIEGLNQLVAQYKELMKLMKLKDPVDQAADSFRTGLFMGLDMRRDKSEGK